MVARSPIFIDRASKKGVGPEQVANALILRPGEVLTRSPVFTHLSQKISVGYEQVVNRLILGAVAVSALPFFSAAFDNPVSRRSQPTEQIQNTLILVPVAVSVPPFVPAAFDQPAIKRVQFYDQATNTLILLPPVLGVVRSPIFVDSASKKSVPYEQVQNNLLVGAVVAATPPFVPYAADVAASRGTRSYDQALNTLILVPASAAQPPFIPSAFDQASANRRLASDHVSNTLILVPAAVSAPPFVPYAADFATTKRGQPYDQVRNILIPISLSAGPSGRSFTPYLFEFPIYKRHVPNIQMPRPGAVADPMAPGSGKSFKPYLFDSPVSKRKVQNIHMFRPDVSADSPVVPPKVVIRPPIFVPPKLTRSFWYVQIPNNIILKPSSPPVPSGQPITPYFFEFRQPRFWYSYEQVSNELIPTPLIPIQIEPPPPLTCPDKGVYVGPPYFWGIFYLAAPPIAKEGDFGYACDGLKVGEQPDSGTGIPVYFSQCQWRTYTTDAPAIGGKTSFICTVVPQNRGVFFLKPLPLATLAAEGDYAFISNGRQVGEAPGAGTGVPAYYSIGLWREYSTDAPVLV